ncbi:hypothetical protein KXJ69_08830 [Aureisphaera sp. CAU 1614]|uniref:Right handed beta helix domain-containing protein n=1 Tax=Halomarinibacterium sedimenti TaxID=2857106 RepID=A0A9X1JZ56_9FLAO|nr:hypothetical protein [Halomarinibacterium sedimenti]MBW2938207.1 hypothetical protein [Halomarinibacterium sedimenti]
MKYLYGLALIASVLLWSSCRNDFETSPNTGNLEFSKDTVYLDTVFSNIGSSTYNLKVYNKSDKDINIPTVRLAQGETSNYRLNVDGVPGKTFQDVQVLANDSIFIFIETTVDIANQGNNTQFLYTDQIVFDSGSNEQKVELVTLIQDAVFLFPADLGNGIYETLNLGMDDEGNDILIEGFFLDDNELTFTNEKPYVIYGYAAVPPGKTLNVQPGARVHFHSTSGILVANTGSIKSNGAPSNDPVLLENEIIFEGDRLEPDYADIPGQWGTIWLTAGSTNNEFSYTTIKNNVVGLLMESNDGDRTLTLNNVQIYNSSNVGLLVRTGDVYGENMVIANSGQSSLAIQLGGKYTFNHCTFGNYWTNSFRTFPTVTLDNSLPISDTEILVADLIEANFNNCIIYGSEQKEVAFVEDPSAAFNFNFTNCLIRFEDSQGDFDGIPNYDFENPALFTDCIFNLDPIFQDVTVNNLNIEEGTSGAQGIGLGGIMPPFDLNGTARDGNSPDAGAYEATIFPVED